LTRQFASIFPIRYQDDDMHVIAVTMKGFILPQFYCKQTHHRPNQRMQIDMMTNIDQPNLPLLGTSQCMSLPFTTPNTQ
jgi:hypothetical protein